MVHLQLRQAFCFQDMSRMASGRRAFVIVCALYIFYMAATTEAEQKALRLNLRHAKPQGSPDNKLATLTHLVNHDTRRLQSRLARLSHSHSHSLAAAGNGALDTPLTSAAAQGVAQYVVDLEFGTPPRNASLIVDTGSDLLWTKCLYNISTSSTAGYFLANGSSTFLPTYCKDPNCTWLPSSGCSELSICTYNYSYVGGDVAQGVLAWDTVSVDGVAFNATAFGCTATSQADTLSGVLGLGSGQLSFASQIKAHTFSYCLLDHLANSTATSSLVLGTRQSSQPLNSTQLLSNPVYPNLYYVQIDSLSVGGKDLGLPAEDWTFEATQGNGGTIFDSGTSLTYFLGPVATPLIQAFNQSFPQPRVSSDTFPICFKDTNVTAPYPTLSITFQGGAVFEPPANNYIFETDDGVSCLAILNGDNLSPSHIIGNILQQNFIVQYDRTGSTIQFAPADCSKES